MWVGVFCFVVCLFCCTFLFDFVMVLCGLRLCDCVLGLWVLCLMLVLCLLGWVLKLVIRL